MMFRQVRFDGGEWRSLDRLSRSELARIISSRPGEGNALTGLPLEQLQEQARILLSAPEDCFQ